MTDEATRREALVDVMRRAVAGGLSNGTSGNASCHLDDDHILITPSGDAVNSSARASPPITLSRSLDTPVL